MEQLGAPGFYHVIARYGYTQRVQQVRLRCAFTGARPSALVSGTSVKTRRFLLLHHRVLSR